MRIVDSGRGRVDAFLKSGIDTWEEEGRISPQQAETLNQSLNMPEVEHGLIHVGAHFAISLPLRFPLGATARFLYTFGMRLQAEASALRRREKPVEARRTHTLLVMLIALLPGFGRLAYFFSPALAGHRLLLIIPVDQVARKLPGKPYKRLHLDALFVYWADAPVPAGACAGPRESLLARAALRLKGLAPYARPLAAVFAVEALAFGIGGYLYLESGRTSIWWFEERSVIATLDVVQLLVAAAAGISVYVIFWRHANAPSKADAAGIFLWGIGGIGLVLFAIDDYFTIHENMGDFLYDHFSFLPEFANDVDDLLVLLYAAAGLSVLFVFRMELSARRNSTTLLYLAAGASILMVLTDAFAHALALKALELPMQTIAVTFLMFAFIARYREVKASLQAENTEQQTMVTT